jgi:Toprim-like
MKEIHVISENDLQHVRKAGKRLRALCPIHHSRDRDLSINPCLDYYLDEEEERLAGFGHCHSANCGATILVQEWNPTAAAHILGRPVSASEPRITMTSKEIEQAEEWQRRELAALNKIYPFAARQLRNLRAYAYLAQRGLGDQTALDLLESLDVAYIPPIEEWKTAPAPEPELKKWCDRVIFPFTCSGNERGYIGRSLALWLPGMDENEHKRLLNEHDARMEQEHGDQAARYQLRRWRKTYKSGFFNASAMAEHRHVYMCEGPFDALPLLLAGLPAIAVAGTHIDIEGMKAAKRLYDVTLAFDLDMQGKEAIEKTTDLLRGIGVDPVFVSPPDDDGGKDWSERYRRSGLAGLAVLLEADRQRYQGEQASAPAPVEELCMFPESCGDCGAHMSLDDGRSFFFLPLSDSQALCYCDFCRDPETKQPRQASAPALPVIAVPLDDPVVTFARQFLQATVSIDPPGYTLAEHVQKLEQEAAARRRQDIADRRARLHLIATG